MKIKTTKTEIQCISRGMVMLTMENTPANLKFIEDWYFLNAYADLETKAFPFKV